LLIIIKESKIYINEKGEEIPTGKLPTTKEVIEIAIKNNVFLLVLKKFLESLKKVS